MVVTENELFGYGCFYVISGIICSAVAYTTYLEVKQFKRVAADLTEQDSSHNVIQTMHEGSSNDKYRMVTGVLIGE